MTTTHTITTPKSKQYFDIFDSRKEAIAFIMDSYINNKEWIDDDFSLYIEYNDGSCYYLSGTVEDGKFKKTGIKTIIESNPSSFSLYGEYRIYNTDNTEEEYSEENDSEEKTWNVDVR